MEIFGQHVRMVHGAQGIARRIVAITEGQKFDKTQPDRFVSIGETPGIAALQPALLRYGLEDVSQF